MVTPTVEKSAKNYSEWSSQRTKRLDFGARYDDIMTSVEDDFGFFNQFLGFCWSIPWTRLYKLRRTHRRAVVAVVAAVAVVTAAARAGV